jgi:hypothetical protein
LLVPRRLHDVSERDIELLFGRGQKLPRLSRRPGSVMGTEAERRPHPRPGCGEGRGSTTSSISIEELAREVDGEDSFPDRRWASRWRLPRLSSGNGSRSAKPERSAPLSRPPVRRSTRQQGFSRAWLASRTGFSPSSTSRRAGSTRDGPNDAARASAAVP